MSFYHGSKNPNIIELTTNHSKDGFVYTTSNRLVALTYAARTFTNYKKFKIFFNFILHYSKKFYKLIIFVVF